MVLFPSTRTAHHNRWALNHRKGGSIHDDDLAVFYIITVMQRTNNRRNRPHEFQLFLHFARCVYLSTSGNFHSPVLTYFGISFILNLLVVYRLEFERSCSSQNVVCGLIMFGDSSSSMSCGEQGVLDGFFHYPHVPGTYSSHLVAT